MIGNLPSKDNEGGTSSGQRNSVQPGGSRGEKEGIPQTGSEGKGQEEIGYVKKSGHKKVSDDFFISKRGENGKIVHEKVKGRKVKLDVPGDFFVHKNVGDEEGYTVTEGITGVKLKNGDTEEDAISASNDYVNKYADQFEETIKNLIDDRGVTPRYGKEGEPTPKQIEAGNYPKEHITTEGNQYKQLTDLGYNNEQIASLGIQPGLIEEIINDKTEAIRFNDVYDVEGDRAVKKAAQPPSGKQPWEMTRDELDYANAMIKEKIEIGESGYMDRKVENTPAQKGGRFYSRLAIRNMKVLAKPPDFP